MAVDFATSVVLLQIGEPIHTKIHFEPLFDCDEIPDANSNAFFVTAIIAGVVAIGFTPEKIYLGFVVQRVSDDRRLKTHEINIYMFLQFSRTLVGRQKRSSTV